MDTLQLFEVKGQTSRSHVKCPPVANYIPDHVTSDVLQTFKVKG